MANFKLNPTVGRCNLCGRQGRDHCAVAYPTKPERSSANANNLRVCSECGALIQKVVTSGKDYVRNRSVEKPIEQITKERTRKRKIQSAARRRKLQASM